ncbi:restriction endonuclease family protein [Lyngbya aestuarii BL J]|uniref:Restriction endonuclease family protein n=1 Tax=Lyngbya aestuarii BL J TaxID=1348334 RepID=U7QFJ8_9CYAN|nr:Uma2 family endonuclease [Lyngbya aestuarii]ERT06032.1 restriction endonuclease family protein [Lyngbya aestuarii BL J]
MDGVNWQIYEGLLETLQDSSEFRVTYLEGTLEIMSPSRRHESEKKRIALLLETYFMETEVDFYPLGSTTFREQSISRGIEPDECYCINSEKSVPDIAIEVVITSGAIPRHLRALAQTRDLAVSVESEVCKRGNAHQESGGINSLEIYQGLKVPEVWFWQKGKFSLYSLRENGYEEIYRSQFLPELDFELLASYIRSSAKPKDILLEFRQRLKNSKI